MGASSDVDYRLHVCQSLITIATMRSQPCYQEAINQVRGLAAYWHGKIRSTKRRFRSKDDHLVPSACLLGWRHLVSACDQHPATLPSRSFPVSSNSTEDARHDVA
jgi:hypothetical protein